MREIAVPVCLKGTQQQQKEEAPQLCLQTTSEFVLHQDCHTEKHTNAIMRTCRLQQVGFTCPPQGAAATAAERRPQLCLQTTSELVLHQHCCAKQHTKQMLGHTSRSRTLGLCVSWGRNSSAGQGTNSRKQLPVCLKGTQQQQWEEGPQLCLQTTSELVLHQHCRKKLGGSSEGFIVGRHTVP